MSPCTSERKGAAQGLHYIVEFAVILLGTPVLVMVEKNIARHEHRTHGRRPLPIKDARRLCGVRTDGTLGPAISCCVALGSGSGLYQNRDGRGAWWPVL